MTLELNLPFDAEGNTQLLIDETLAVNVSRNDEEGRLTLAAPVAQELREDIGYAQMLELHDLALAYASVSYVHVTEAEWPEILGRFVAFAKGIAEKL